MWRYARTTLILVLLAGSLSAAATARGQGSGATVTLVAPAGGVAYPLSGGLLQLVVQVEPDPAAVEAGDLPPPPELRVNDTPLTAADDRSLGLSLALAHDEAVRRVDPSAPMARINQDAHFYLYSVDPCMLPGGSDLPGSMLTVAVGESSQVVTLGRDTKAPVIALDGAPTRAQPGQTLQVTVSAREERATDSWQTGVRSLRVIRPDASVAEQATAGDAPHPCDQKQWDGQITVTYTVPDGARPGSELSYTVEAVDWQGNRAMRTLTIPVVEQEWTGTWRVAGMMQTVDGLYMDTLEAQFTFRVGAEGRIVGSGTATMTLTTGGTNLVPGPAVCTVVRTLDTNTFTFDVGGRREGMQFVLTFPLPPVIPPASEIAHCPTRPGVRPVASPIPAFFGIGACQGSPASFTVPAVEGHEVRTTSRCGYQFDARLTLRRQPLP